MPRRANGGAGRITRRACPTVDARDWIAPRRSGVRVPLAPSPGIRGLYAGFGRFAFSGEVASTGLGEPRGRPPAQRRGSDPQPPQFPARRRGPAMPAHLRVTDAEEHAHALGRREGQIEAAHASRAALDLRMLATSDQCSCRRCVLVLSALRDRIVSFRDLDAGSSSRSPASGLYRMCAGGLADAILRPLRRERAKPAGARARSLHAHKNDARISTFRRLCQLSREVPESVGDLPSVVGAHEMEVFAVHG